MSAQIRGKRTAALTLGLARCSVGSVSHGLRLRVGRRRDTQGRYVALFSEIKNQGSRIEKRRSCRYPYRYLCRVHILAAGYNALNKNKIDYVYKRAAGKAVELQVGNWPYLAMLRIFFRMWRGRTCLVWRRRGRERGNSEASSRRARCPSYISERHQGFNIHCVVNESDNETVRGL